ncbi:GATA transcription factor 12-like [Punica granatum]|uniref:GATA transcription factor n=2 Tax=Punica granatum TaxID=22663 RepID=A0A218XDQ5_PUNGR|nr:GATA transcription factor 12-like [Punica granatum]OWM82829.1 hypothetical protein CDL15_Pgr029190 [Punica granatum]PKI65409.1 hypothetical protein CRG98_014148 [Punica granatum]
MEAPDQFFHGGYCAAAAQLTPQNCHHLSSLENKDVQHFAVEDLLDFSKDDVGAVGGVVRGLDSAAGGSSTDSSTLTVVDSCNSASFSGCDPGLAAAATATGGGGGGDIGCCAGFADNDQFSNELCVPYDDLAELEWLSNIVEESFSSEDLQKLQLISGIKARPDEGSETTAPEFQPELARPHHHGKTINSPIFHSDVSFPAKARSKRSRSAPCNWASRLLILSEPTNDASSTEPDRPAPMSPQPAAGKKNSQACPKKKPMGPEGIPNGEGRKCLHCATDKTPQWRTGPMGPKTLCNACGVRYKSGRLVPEYRPAASPTFVLTKHSNSHRKVLELRRQKDLLRSQQLQQHHQQFSLQGQNTVFDITNSDDYLIHQNVGPDFRQLT